MRKNAALKVVYVALLVGLVAAGTAAAFLLRTGRDVTTSSAEAYRLYRLGVENERKMYPREAISAYAAALAQDPHFVMASLRLAALLSGRDPERARSLVTCATQRLDGLTDREKALAEIYKADLVAHDRARVAALLDDYVKRFPQDPEGIHRRGSMLLWQGKQDEAVREYERLLRIDPNFASAYNMLGYFWMQRGDAVKAEDNFKRYRYLAPDQANPYDSLGELYTSRGRYGEAEASLKKALEIKPDFFPSVGHLGTTFYSQGRYREASEQFARAAQMTEALGDRIQFAFSAGLALADGGEPGEAVAEFDRLVATLPAVDPELRKKLSTAVALNRALLLAVVGRVPEAETELAAAPEEPAPPGGKGDDSGEARTLVRAVIDWQTGDLESAAKILRAVIDARAKRGMEQGYYPNRDRIALAKVLSKLGRFDEERQVLAPILKVNPRFQPAVDLLASVGREGDGASVARN